MFIQSIRPGAERAVLLLHGLGRTAFAMETLGRFLHTQAGFTVCNLRYYTRHCDITGHARDLARALQELRDVREINFVAHSLGNEVIRRYFALCAGNEVPADDRIGRLVMLAPPNHGSACARRIANHPVYGHLARSILGPSFAQLADWEAVAHLFATPPCEFGILAAKYDGKVTIEEAHLEGAAEFHVLPCMHTWIMNRRDARRMTLQFFQTGSFSSDTRRQPSTECSGAQHSS
jgi:hypothetical protein